MDSFRNNIEKMLRLCIIYILLQTATCAMKYGYQRNLDDDLEFSNYDRPSKQQRYDKILSSLHSLFKERSPDDTDDSKSTDDYNDFNFNAKDKQQFNDILAEVTTALDKIKDELIKFNNDGVLTVDIPGPVAHEKRYKRDLSNKTVANVTITVKNVTQNNVTTTEKPETVTEKVEVLRVRNETLKVDVLRPNDTDPSLNSNSRRMVPVDYVTTTSRVKDKLLSYLEDTFNEVERKIRPLTNIKIALSNDDHYRIGYIIATIDTLEVNLKKLKNDMNLHQHYWDDEKILDLFDRIKATNTVATSLIESLKKYLPRHN